MNLPSYFREFLSTIEPSSTYKDDQQAGHKTLRRRLADDSEFGALHLNTFLQGSYKRHTAIHPGKDVDVVVVTSINPDEVTAAEGTALLGKCLRKYYNNVTLANRSFCVELSYVTLDVVLATSRHLDEDALLTEAFLAADSIDEARAWTEHPLLIPDRELATWVETHPKRQLKWTSDKNALCGNYFVPLVKMFKWWRRVTYERPKYPKGYVLERLAGECVDTTQRDDANGFVRLLENIQSKYTSLSAMGLVPTLPDAGVPSHNVAHRLSSEDFSVFMRHIAEALPLARAALAEPDVAASARLWADVFGDKFPAPPARASFPPAPVKPNKPAGFA